MLHATEDVSVDRFDHPPHELHEDPDREVAGRWSIAFVVSGGFDVLLDDRRHRLSAGSLFISRPGLTFACAHHEDCPSDVCIAVGYSDAAVDGLEDAWTRAGWSARSVATPRLAYVQRRLQEATGPADTLAVERWALSAVDALAADSAGARPRGRYAARVADLDAVQHVCRLIEQDPTARRSVASRARDVGLTGTRLSHAFRRYVGVSPHRYIIRQRIRLAATLLDEGNSVSETCLDAGFENLSHFSRTFQRALGVRASVWRSLSSGERRRKVQALLARAT